MLIAAKILDRRSATRGRVIARISLARALLSRVALAACVALVPLRAAADYCVKHEDCPLPMATESPRGIALGTGMRASAISTSALAYSPGALAIGNLYHVEGNVDYMSRFKTTALGAAVVDSSTSNVVGAGFGLRGFLSGQDGYGGIDGRLGVGVAASEAISLGVAGRFISLSQADVKVARGFAMDASLRVMPVSGFQLDLAALNFVSNARSPFVPFDLATGAAFALIPSLSAGADVIIDMTTYKNPQVTVGGGAEFLAAGMVPLRLGYLADLARSAQAITAGVGYTDARIGLDLGLRQQIKGGHETRIMAAFRYYVN